MEPTASFFRLASPTGASLAVRHQPARARERAVLLLHHGLAEHAGRYHRFMAFMAARGFHTYAHDHRGHGETTAADAPRGRFARTDGAKLVIADCKAVLDHARAGHPQLPVIVFGHSMGGLIALNFAEAHPNAIAGLAVWNANFDGGLLGRAAQAILAIEAMRLGSDVPSRLLPALTFSAWGRAIAGRRTEFDWLSRDPAEVDAYIADPACGFAASVSMWQDVFALIFSGRDTVAIARLPKDLPIHLVGGGADPSTDRGRAVTRLAKRLVRAGLRDVTGRIYPRFRHETLNETGAAGPMEDFSAWADRVLIAEARAREAGNAASAK